jgi:hypothetical protein
VSDALGLPAGIGLGAVAAVLVALLAGSVRPAGR